jgi:hypothetical protein
MIMWIFASVAGGLLTGYVVTWPVAVAACGALALLAATDFLPAGCVLYFAAACMIASSGQAPARFSNLGVAAE